MGPAVDGDVGATYDPQDTEAVAFSSVQQRSHSQPGIHRSVKGLQGFVRVYIGFIGLLLFYWALAGCVRPSYQVRAGHAIPEGVRMSNTFCLFSGVSSEPISMSRFAVGTLAIFMHLLTQAVPQKNSTHS